MISDAGLDRSFFREKAQVYQIEKPEIEIQRALDIVRQTARKLERPPFKSEIPEELRKPLIERCGSFRNVLFQIGLEPVTRITPFSAKKIEDSKSKKKPHRRTLEDCYYQILNPDIQTQKDLEELYRMKESLKRLPEKKEVDVNLRVRLQKSCGSWANALNQLKYIEQGRETKPL